MSTATSDRRSLRTRRALREALAAEIAAMGELGNVTVTGLCARADITRRTFYFHYKDIPDLVDAVEQEALEALAPLVAGIARTNLDELEEAISSFRPCPGSVELISWFETEGADLGALLGEGGDPAFAEKIKAMVREVVERRALEGFSSLAFPLFDYYLTYAISAEVGVIARWLTTGMRESAEEMGCIMTALMFVRPGDLYGRHLSFDLISAAKAAMSAVKEA